MILNQETFVTTNIVLTSITLIGMIPSSCTLVQCAKLEKFNGLS